MTCIAVMIDTDAGHKVYEPEIEPKEAGSGIGGGQKMRYTQRSVCRSVAVLVVYAHVGGSLEHTDFISKNAGLGSCRQKWGDTRPH
jgi:hypothetical protein